jgi:hypothetical protein
MSPDTRLPPSAPPRRLKTWQWLLLALLLAFAADWWIQRPDSRSRELNRVIETQGSALLKAYPYRFHVLRVEGGTAVLGTPRNVDVPALRFIGAIHPEIDVKNAGDPAFIAAETTLAAVQSEASRLVAAQPGIAAVRWELDKPWLNAHGIDVPAK